VKLGSEQAMISINFAVQYAKLAVRKNLNSRGRCGRGACAASLGRHTRIARTFDPDQVFIPAAGGLVAFEDLVFGVKIDA